MNNTNAGLNKLNKTFDDMLKTIDILTEDNNCQKK